MKKLLGDNIQDWVAIFYRQALLQDWELAGEVQPDGDFHCKYRYGSSKCIVGSLIPDKYYNPGIENFEDSIIDRILTE